MEDFFDISEVLYQKFLLDIYRHCDKLELRSISPNEKEKMAVEMVGFVGKVINSLENKKPLMKIEKNNSRSLKKISQMIETKVKCDEFAKSVVNYYISKKKISKDDLSSYLTVAAIVVVSKGKKTDIKDLEEKIANAKPYVFRVASLLSPAVCLHEKLFTKVSSQHSHEEVFASQNFDMSFTKYID